MKKILFDCDSTVGLPGKPMDDALALLYLLGRPEECQVLGITCTFGNGTADEVFASTPERIPDPMPPGFWYRPSVPTPARSP